MSNDCCCGPYQYVPYPNTYWETFYSTNNPMNNQTNSLISTGTNQNISNTGTSLLSTKDIIEIFKSYCETFEIPITENVKNYCESFGVSINTKNKENNMFDKILSRAKDGMFRISMSGDIAVQSDNGYKTFDAKTKKLVNCSDFIFDVGDEWFFVVPATKVKEGDIILVNDKPKCVISVGDLISVLNYENSTVEQIVPERHLFMGNVYFYSKVKSMFGHGKKGKKNPLKKIMKWKLMSQMFKGNNAGFGSSNDFSKLMAFSMFMKDNDDFTDMFEDMFDFDEDDLEVFPENKDESKEE